MKEPFSPDCLPTSSVFFACSSHEERCLGIVRRWGAWRPSTSAVFHYDDPNAKREENHKELLTLIETAGTSIEIPFTEKNAVQSFQRGRGQFSTLLETRGDNAIVVDISVLTKRHLLMLLRWLDDHDYWDRLWVVYSEPDEYEIESHIPLSFGVSTFEQVPGFSAAPDSSRPMHLAMFLGYEGDRSFATFETLQPQRTTLIVPDPPFRREWLGRTEALNHNLLSVVGTRALRKADSLDPESACQVLHDVLGPPTERADVSRVLSPLGTKPQILGAYSYIRQATDPPAVIYTGALRHNHSFYSHGVGPSWLIHRPS